MGVLSDSLHDGGGTVVLVRYSKEGAKMPQANCFKPARS